MPLTPGITPELSSKSTEYSSKLLKDSPHWDVPIVTSSVMKPSPSLSQPSESLSSIASLEFRGSSPYCASQPSGIPSPNTSNGAGAISSQKKKSESENLGSVPIHPGSPVGLSNWS